MSFFSLSHCGTLQSCDVYQVKAIPGDLDENELNRKFPRYKGLYIWFLPVCCNPKCEKKKRAAYYVLDRWNNWQKLQDIPKIKIDAALSDANKVKKKDLKEFRRLSKLTVLDKRFYLFASVYGQKVKCYSSNLGKLPTPDEDLLLINQ